MNSAKEEDLKLVSEVEERILSSMNLGVDLSELNLLDDVNISKNRIQELGMKINNKNDELIIIILEMARSIYFGHFSQGHIADFFDAVMRLGADRIKILVLSHSLFSLGKGKEARTRAAKSFSISILSRIIAKDINLKDEIVRKVETGGLLCQLGKNLFLKARELGMDVSDEFIANYEVTLAVLIVERLKLDPFFKKTVDMSVMELDEDSVSLVGIIKLAEALTEDSFKRYGKLALKSPMPDSFDVLSRTPGDDIKKLFAILGLEEYVEVRDLLTQRQKEAIEKHEKKMLHTHKNKSA